GARPPGCAGGGDRGRLPRGQRAERGLPRRSARVRGETQAGVEGSVTRATGVLLAALAILGCRREQEPPHADPQPKAAASAPPATRDISPHLAALAGDDRIVADDAEQALVDLGPGVVPWLLAAFPNQPPAARVGIVRVLAELRTDDAVVALMQSAAR